MSTMAVSSGAVGRSSLNPNAALFIPMSYQQVEDFSPEWWELVKTTPWFREHWFHQYQEQETFGNDEEDMADVLLDSFDIGITEFSLLEAESDGAAYHEPAKEMISGATEREKIEHAIQLYCSLMEEHYSDAKAAIKDLSLKSPKNGVKPLSVPAKYREKPLQCVSPKYSPRRIIHQPR
ncbi:polyadenylate-binding protein-interacting protein [Musa troglodytarum]|uniref:Polyadenylate-binding protein-interacting protein n=1 Tax=Musa troglodytarum TaxID=320322 RepID=A0A9E7EKL1_9LILI|nr:polyadenylate-binding protein-interacting protein [Musa troglodytarum]